MSLDPAMRHAVADLYAAYAACLDDGRYEEWPDFFTADGWYRVVARENFDRNLPLSVISLKGQPMMVDRVVGSTSTIFHAPYYQRHIVGLPMVSLAEDSAIHASAGYAVIRTKRDMAAEIYNVGRYIDEIVFNSGEMKFRRRFCIYDNDIIPNSMIYPI